MATISIKILPFLNAPKVIKPRASSNHLFLLKKRDFMTHMSKGTGGAAGREVIFEFVQMGAYVKVMAIDVATGTEVSIAGPSSAPEQQLRQTALRKLNYVLEKDKK